MLYQPTASVASLKLQAMTLGMFMQDIYRHTTSVQTVHSTISEVIIWRILHFSGTPDWQYWFLYRHDDS